MCEGLYAAGLCKICVRWTVPDIGVCFRRDGFWGFNGWVRVLAMGAAFRGCRGLGGGSLGILGGLLAGWVGLQCCRGDLCGGL